jgi:transposase
MKRVRDRVGALDVHRDSVTAACRSVDVGTGEIIEDVEQFSTMSGGLVRLGGWLLERHVTTVAMESTGVYWKPVYYALEGMFEELWVVNAQHVKNVPGRKSDIADAVWLADVVAHGMVRASFVPPQPIRELRELTRYRKTQIEARSREIQRLEKVLQDACVKLTSVTSTVWSKSSRAMIEALIAGERDPAVLAELAQSRMRSKIPELTDALAANWRRQHSFVARRIIAHIDFLDTTIAELSSEIAERVTPFDELIERLDEVPGIDRKIAEILIAETGGDMSRFPTPEQLCAWAGVVPGNRESAGKRRPAGTRPGARWLRRALVEGAWAAVRTKDSYFNAHYHRIARHRGKNKAVVAVAHSILNVCWHLMNDPQLRYQDLGADWFQRHQDPKRKADRLVKQLAELGYRATLEPAA